MRTKSIALLTALILALAVGCSQNRANQPSVKENVERSLDSANLKDVNVDEDRDKGVVTVKGEVKSEADKAQAEEIAKASAGNMIIANEISVRPEGMEGEAKSIEGDLDSGIKSNLEAAFTANKLDNEHINIDVNNGVVKLKGDVETEAQRKMAEKVAAKVPNVTQVVNELEVKK
jgi:hyperosmotically inducible protein